MTNKGSEWRKWDLHIHSKYSYESSTKLEVLDIFKAAIEKSIKVISITDHSNVDSLDEIWKVWENQSVTINGHSVKISETIDFLPGCELKTDKGKHGVHIVVVFPKYFNKDKIDKNYLELQFLSKINCSKQDVQTTGGGDFKKGLLEIVVAFEKTADQAKKLGGLLIVHAGGKTNGIEKEISHAKDESDKFQIWNSLGSKKRELMEKYIDICELPNASEKSLKEAKFYLEKFNKPSILSSDSHDSYTGSLFTWIKADPTFEGLMQITYEPEARVFIGGEPEIEIRTRNNPRNYIKSLYVNRIDEYDDRHGKWFNAEKIELNKELVAIIGNKGSGKSAVTDIMGLLGNSHNQKYLGQNGKHEELFSFLNREKFLKGGLCASNFFGELHWYDGAPSKNTLDGNTDTSIPESVEYLPQKYLEKICTNIEDDEFRQKLNEVIFGYVEEKDRYGKTSLESLITYLATQTEEDIAKTRVLLHKENEKVVEIERKLTQEYKKGIEEQLKLKHEEVDAHNKIKPPTVPKPTKDESAIAKTTAQISKLDGQITKLDDQITALKTEQATIAKLNEDLRQGREAIKRQVEAVITLEATYKVLLEKAGLKFNEVVSITANYKKLDDFIKVKSDRLEVIGDSILSENDIQNLGLDTKQADIAQKKSFVFKLAQVKADRKKIVDTLDEPNKAYHENLKLQEAWQKRLEELVGNIKNPTRDTLNWLKNEGNNIVKVYPNSLIGARSEREKVSKGIFAKKTGQLTLYNFVKQSIDTEISKYGKDLEGYDISVDAGLRLVPSFFDEFFKYVNQSVRGSFYNVDDGRASLKMITDSISDWQVEKTVFDAIGLVMNHLDTDQRTDVLPDEDKSRDIFRQMKQYKNPVDFYDYLFGFEYLKPKYDLKVDKKDLSELSPGERGGLLLIFYLMLDRRDIPLIIDQPEDNLDNKSIYEILVRFLKKAKRKRQIIMVTHNPNLAVVADAEQIIHVSIDKKNKNDFDFSSGSIENPEINKCVVDILEGTMPAFDNRRLKYRKQITP